LLGLFVLTLINICVLVFYLGLQKQITPMSNKQQTAVKQFWQDLQDILPSSVDTETGMKLLKALKRAKKMEKEQMENLWDAAISHGGCKCYDEIMTFEEYYKETFNK
jgi:hypothetical protein